MAQDGPNMSQDGPYSRTLPKTSKLQTSKMMPCKGWWWSFTTMVSWFHGQNFRRYFLLKVYPRSGLTPVHLGFDSV